MALQKITKRAVKGSLLVQYKFVENEGVWTHSSTSNSYAIVANKTLDITPQYPNSVLETNVSFSLGDSSSTDNSSDRYSSALFVTNLVVHYNKLIFQKFKTYLTTCRCIQHTTLHSAESGI